MTSSILYISAVIVCCYATQRRYDGYKLLRTIPNTADDVISLRVSRDMTEGDEVDFWNNIQQVGMPVDIMVSPEMKSDLVALLGNYGLSAEIAVEDIQVLIDDQIRPSLRSRVVKRDAPSSEGFDYNVYHSLDEITDWIDEIVVAHANIATKVEVGSSHEGRVISALKIGRGSPTGDSKPAVWLQGGIHAREWISPATLLFITNELVSKYGSQNEITTLLDGLNIYIIPVFNVDGYEFTWTGVSIVFLECLLPYLGVLKCGS
ncbi:carboxypeptidase A5-like [Anneissia japonica]|uniref:carboxypeptidase A5-like n=1 Tax=Anneissia japonica TaxID=1529436 RepID=UPI00142578D1|nr:carboxypeptidase A5-like [Anneissia japonica]XP_033123547.1 carboxypeptidase A5-like [Anneissia japonica]